MTAGDQAGTKEPEAERSAGAFPAVERDVLEAIAAAQPLAEVLDLPAGRLGSPQ